MKLFGDKIKELRIERSLKQSDIADDIDIGRSTLSQYETNFIEITLSVAIKLAEYFDVSLDYLCGRTDNPDINK